MVHTVHITPQLLSPASRSVHSKFLDRAITRPRRLTKTWSDILETTFRSCAQYMSSHRTVNTRLHVRSDMTVLPRPDNIHHLHVICSTFALTCHLMPNISIKLLCLPSLIIAVGHRTTPRLLFSCEGIMKFLCFHGGSANSEVSNLPPCEWRLDFAQSLS